MSVSENRQLVDAFWAEMEASSTTKGFSINDSLRNQESSIFPPAGGVTSELWEEIREKLLAAQEDRKVVNG